MNAAVKNAFDEIVSAWDETLGCQTGQRWRPCNNAARWLAIHHDGGQTPVCTFHRTRWLRIVRETIAHFGWFECWHCGEAFTRPEQCVTYRPI